MIGHLDGIYEFRSSPPPIVPEKIIEFWCRNVADETGIEVISYYDSGTQQSSSKVFYATLNPDSTYSKKSIPEFPVTSTALGPKESIISPADDFRLYVYRDQPATQPGLYNAQLEIFIESQYYQLQTYCRLGARYDSGK